MADKKTLYRVVLVTVPEAPLAEKIAKGLVEEKLAACVNEIPGVISRYIWEGQLQTAEEILLLIKTRAGLLPQVIEYVKENHSAKVPEIVSLPILGGDRSYLDWLGANTLFAAPSEEDETAV